MLFLLSASVFGLYYRIMSDAAHMRTVDGTRTGIEHRVKLECEREQQEQLLLSVIPAYIAAEVSELTGGGAAACTVGQGCGSEAGEWGRDSRLKLQEVVWFNFD